MSDFTANFAGTDLFRSASDSVRTLVRAVKSNVRSRADKRRWTKADKKAMQPVNLSIRAMQTAENAEDRARYAQDVAEQAQTQAMVWQNDMRHMQAEMAYLKTMLGNQGWQIQQQRSEILRLEAELEYERVIRDEMAETMSTGFRSAARSMDAAAEQMEGIINDRCQAIMPGVYADPVAALDAMRAEKVPAGWEYAG